MTLAPSETIAETAGARVDDSPPVEIELRLLRLIREFWNAVDVEDWPRLLSMLTDDVDYQLAGLCRGKAEVAAALQLRPELHASRHMLSNEVVRTATGGYEITFLCAAYSYLPRKGMAPPYPTPPPIVIDGRARVRAEGADLRFSFLSATPVYISEYHMLASEMVAMSSARA